MAFDFQSAIAAANAVVESQENRGDSQYKYPLVYPQAGQTITIKPLFNPKSGQIVRLVHRHEKVACYRTYGVDCPICKIQQQVKDLTGQDPFGRTKRSKSRGICFAQYVTSSEPIDKGSGRGNLQPGEVILFMFPWSVYTQINTTIQAIAQTPTGMDQAFCHAKTGLILQISVTPDFRYTTTTVPYMVLQNCQQTDDQFMSMLEGMDSLMDQVLPPTITEEVDKQVKEYTDAIYRQYISPQVPNQAPVTAQPASVASFQTPPAYQPQNVPPQYMSSLGFAPAQEPAPVATSMTAPPWGTQPSQYTPSVGTAPQSIPSSEYPSCFGKHQNDSTTCICCPHEMICIEKSPS